MTAIETTATETTAIERTERRTTVPPRSPRDPGRFTTRPLQVVNPASIGHALGSSPPIPLTHQRGPTLRIPGVFRRRRSASSRA